MERVDGYRSNSSLFILNEFLYNKNKHRGETSYLVCRYNQNCPGRVIVRNGIPDVVQEHNHDADFAEAQLFRFKTVLRSRARLENTSFDQIFREEERRFPEAARLIGGLRSFKSTMARCRQFGTPPVPPTILEYSQTIHHQQWYQRYGADLSPEENAFFRGHVVAEDGSMAVIFISETILQHVRRTTHARLHMDGTFKVVPRTIGAIQLFTVHILHDDMTFPLLYSLMQRKTRALYTAVLLELRRVLGNVTISSIMADYESSMRMAAVTVFPRTELRGCWFHYARAIFKKSQELGLQRRPYQQATRRIVRVAMVLPLLPQNMLAQGITVVETMGAQANLNMARFILYLRRQWLPLRFSVHGQYHRTNNSVESFHRQLYRLVERPHPNIWQFTEKIKQMEHSKALDLYRLLNGAMLPHRRRRQYLALDSRIRRGEERLAVDGNVERFLTYVSFSLARLERVMNRMPELTEIGPVVPPIVVQQAVIPPVDAPQAVAPAVGIPPAVAPIVLPDVELPVALENNQPAVPPENNTPAVPPENNTPAVVPEINQPTPENPLICLVCLVNERTHLFIDCRHFCVCAICVTHFRRRLFPEDDSPNTRCPICRTPIKKEPLQVII